METNRPANATVTVNGKTYKITAIFNYPNGRRVVAYQTGKRRMTREFNADEIQGEA
jgi:predicted heme/steroid binding protein